MRLESRRRDLALAVALAAGACAYLAALPRNLSGADESYLLYEAKRILDGEVMYRDISQFVSPGAWWAMAGLYGLFGASIDTARLSMAVLHGGIVATVVSICGALGVRPGLRAAAAVAYVALGPPVWPYASPHWLSTLLMLLMLVVALRAPQRTFGLGVLVGLLVAVQQHKGAVTGLGVAGLLALAWLIARRNPAMRQPARALLGAWLRLGLGAAAVVLPVTLYLLATAGVAPVYRHLIELPMIYRTSNYTPWGHVLGLTPYSTPIVPAVLKYLPLVFLVPALRLAVGLWRRREIAALRARLLLAGFGAIAVASVAYFPDYIHLSFIAPFALIAAADTAERGLTALRQPGWLQPAAGAVVASAVLIAAGLELGRVMTFTRHAFPFTHDTPFGRVAFATEREIELIERARTLMAESGSDELFSYPSYVGIYLTTGGRNPTPYQWLQPGFHQAQDFAAVVAALDARRVPLVVMNVFAQPTDPIVVYVKAHYDVVDMGEPFPIFLFTRRADTAREGE